MDEFFRNDALDYTHFLMGKSYCFRLKDDAQTNRGLLHRVQRQHPHLRLAQQPAQCHVEDYAS